MKQPFLPVLVVLFLVTCAHAAEPVHERTITAEDRAHWAFRPPALPPIPGVEVRSWVRNPIDAFVLAEIERNGKTHAAEADRSTLLRRVTFGLTGLPPTVEEQTAFLADTRPDAYERVVDRLLAGPAYGEHQGRKWLDLARYADTDGYEFDAVRPDAWRFRDWVIDAFNRDMPYDEFVLKQIAGDELAEGDPSAFVATGFNRCYPDMVDQNDQGLRRQNALNDMTETTGLVFLGLTIGCARCHDHKFDPVGIADFYRLQAFFTPARFRDDLVIANPEEVAAHERNARMGISPAPLPTARGIDEASPTAPPTYLLKRGDFTSRGPVVEPAIPAVLGETSLPPIETTRRSTGRRLALARWLTDPSHPLTARVMVNRVWQQHFGRGIVATPSDFGVMGDEPTHPQLLDWLAIEFVRGGWSLKELHRRILTSAAYRQSSVTDRATHRDDPENVLITHHSRRRLDGEAIRDAMLAIGGTLDRRMGGPGVFPEIPDEIRDPKLWPVSPDKTDRNRRGVYVFVRRNLRYPFFESFDRPDTNASCPIRPVTTIAPQALSLLNGALARETARRVASRLDGMNESERLEWTFRLTLGRPPDDEEARWCREFVTQSTWEEFVLSLLNVNEFVYVD